MIQRCKDCGLDKPLSEYHRDAAKKLGHRRECKPCLLAKHRRVAVERKSEFSIKRKARYAKNIDKMRAQKRDWIARNREKVLAGKRASHERHRDAILERRRVKWAADPEPHRAKAREWAKANPEYVREYGKQWRENNRLRKRAAWAAWKKKNPERAKEMSRVSANKRYRETLMESREKVRLAASVRRARIMKVDARLTLPQWGETWEIFAGCCAYCLKPADTMEHIVPISTGGAHIHENVVPACKRCNYSKHNTSLLLWIMRVGSSGLAA
jgi:5-methylcytosine-specific restriction endonuclease McrA